MSVSVSNRLTDVRPSATGVVLAKAFELQRQGVDIISLGAGEPDFETPEPIKSAAIEAIRRGETRYTPTDGTTELKNAICAKFQQENRLAYTSGQVLVSNGAKQSMFNLCMAILGPGDEAVVPAPYWVSYPEMVRLAGAEPIIVETGLDEGFKVRPDQLDAVLGPKTRLVFINSPCNPTGVAYSPAELAALGEVLQAWPNVVIASDEIYEHIYWASEPYVSIASLSPELYERTLTVNGVSKAYAMTGWRIGYAAGPEWLIDAMRVVQSQSTTNPCSISQAAAVAALTGDQQAVRDMNREYRSRHDFVVTSLNKMPGMECRAGEGSFYAFPRVAGAVERLRLDDDTALAELLLEEARVVSVPGAAFGAPMHLRFSFACSEEILRTAMDRINRALSA